MDFLELAKQRCTTRGFLNQRIPEDDLNRILSAGRVAPTACNKQPQRIIVVREPDNILKVQKAYQTFNSPCILIVCQDKKEPLIRPYDNKCSGDLDIGIICDHMMLAARELNIGSVMVGLFDPKIIRKEFNIPEYIEPTALLILGYPAKGFSSADRHEYERNPLEETVMYECYGENSMNPDKILAAVCGLFCPSCGSYIGTKEDPERLEAIAQRFGRPVSDVECHGCRSDKRSFFCRTECKMARCAAEKGIDFCGECPEYPCAELKDFQSERPHRLELWQNHERIKEVGYEKWFEEMTKHYSCTKCGIINTAYELEGCRKCGHAPANDYIREHKDEIIKQLSR